MLIASSLSTLHLWQCIYRNKDMVKNRNKWMWAQIGVQRCLVWSRIAYCLGMERFGVVVCEHFEWFSRFLTLQWGRSGFRIFRNTNVSTASTKEKTRTRNTEVRHFKIVSKVDMHSVSVSGWGNGKPVVWCGPFLYLIQNHMVYGLS